MTDQWSEFIDRLIDTCSADSFLDFARRTEPEHGGDEDLAGIYRAVPLIMLTSGLFAEAMCLPGGVAPIAEGLDRLWKASLEERDSSALTDEDAELDEFWAEELEMLRDETDGMLAVLEAYASGEGGPDSDPNALIQQAMFLCATDLPQARRVFGQAGAAALRGARLWPLWHTEVDETIPLGAWLRGLRSLRTSMKLNGWFPLAPAAEQRQKLAGLVSPARLTLGPVVEEGEDPDVEKLSPAEKQLMDILLSGKERLSAGQLAALPPFTPEIVQRLIYTLEDQEYAFENSPGGGWAPIHAAELLARTGAPGAVEALLVAAYESDFEDILYSKALFALGELGPVAVPLLLDTLQYSTDIELKNTVAESLGRAGAGDERAFRALEALYRETSWGEERMLPMMALARQGDPRGTAMFYHSLKHDRDITPEAVREIIWAIKENDPGHDPAELKRLETRAYQRYNSQMVRFDKNGLAFCRDCGGLMEKDSLGEWSHVEPESISARPAAPSRPFSPAPEFGLPAIDPRFKNVGRNDPCPCGSGKKYKHCHGANKPTVH